MAVIERAGRTGKEKFNMIDNYIYLHHVDEFIILPVYPETVQDSASAQFSNETPLMRSAPIYSYGSSGPRQVSFSFKLHREMMQEVNYQASNATVKMGDDYVDTMINYLQAIVLPRYNSGEKLVDPPMVSVRLGDDVFIKGVVNSVSVTYNVPILNINGKDKYALADVSFSVEEVDPYDAETVMSIGSFRGLSTSLERKVWKSGGGLSKGVKQSASRIIGGG